MTIIMNETERTFVGGKKTIQFNNINEGVYETIKCKTESLIVRRLVAF